MKKAQEKDEESVSTSSQARVMIREYTNREMAAILRREIEETVELKPRLLLGKQGVRVEFWIGKERLYIIKDLLSFSKAVGQGAYVEYGKNLAFRHNLEVFSKESRPMVLLLVETMDAYEDYDADLQKKEYNPLVYVMKESAEDMNTLCRLLLTSMMSESAKSFERLPILLHADILRNVLYSGVWSRYEYLQLKKRKKQKAGAGAKKKSRRQRGYES